MSRFTLQISPLLILVAAGCGSVENASSEAQRMDAADKPSVRAATEAIRVAAASDLKFAMEELLAEFRRLQPEIQVEVTFGSSGNFYTQLSNKAPFDLFFSADIEYPRKLVALGLAEKQTEFVYAVGHIVVWVPNASKLDLNRGIDVLTDPAIQKIAIANPRHAPYGRAAEAALKKLGVYEHVESRLVLGENIAQTAQFVETGAADIGVIALSLAMAPVMREKGRFWLIPQDSHPPLVQGGVILKSTQSPSATSRLREFISSDVGRTVLKKYGFAAPDES